MTAPQQYSLHREDIQTISPSASPRQYRSPLRDEQAAQTRQRILDSAGALFAEKSYAGTSLADIAEGAGVSVETVKLNGPKRTLLLAAFEQAFAGSEGHEPIAERADGRAVTEVRDGELFLRSLIDFVTAANERTDGLWSSLLSAASGDEIVAIALTEMLERRHGEYRAIIAMFEERGMLSSDRDRRELADAMSFLLSPESYQQLVGQSGWTIERYREWLIRAVCTLVLAD